MDALNTPVSTEFSKLPAVESSDHIDVRSLVVPRTSEDIG